MKFKSRKDLFFKVIMIGVCLLLTYGFVTGIYKGDTLNSWSLLIFLLVMVFLLWIFFDTRYELTPTTLKYKSGPIKGEIPLKNISEIINNKTLWVGLKPATATKGLIIKYNKFDEIYISPLSNESFIKKIIELNKDIKIVNS